jgi:hypothetical protein
MEQTNFISPFSYSQHEWNLTWKRIPSNAKYDRPVETQSKKEKKALEAIASVGVIGGVQLKRLFNIDKQRLKRMVARKLIVQHELSRGNTVIPIYTIGKHGANKVMPQYEENYWVKFNIEEVLKSLAFFQLYYLLEKASILPSPEPFIGTLRMNNNDFYVYVTRGNSEDLMMFLKWKSFSERIIIITETLNYLKPVEAFIQGLKVRVITDQELRDKSLKFYRLKEKEGSNEWVI